MLQKFANNTANATAYVAALFTGMNVIYERDLDVTLNQGTLILRTSGTADPFAEPGGDIGNQLDEFGEVWVASHSGVTRAFSMQLSGKSPNPNSAAGVAWVLGNGNYCSQTNLVFNGQKYQLFPYEP